MNNDNYTREPLKLLKNKSFPTYQLYAVVDKNKLDRKDVLKLCVLETLSWLRKRFREFDMPSQIRAPEPEQYANIKYEDLKSFHINDGYIVDVVSIPEEGIWAMNLIEPDLGPMPGSNIKGRRAVPGRIFSTNIAYRITGGNVECGFKTICSEPVTTNEMCEVYRLAVIKNIVRNKLLGLRQCTTLVEHAVQVNNKEKLKDLKNLIRNTNRQMPVVVISEYLDVRKISNIDNQCKQSIKNYIRGIDKARLNLDNPDKEPGMISYDTPINIDNIARYKMGYAHFAVIQYDLIDDFTNLLGKEYFMNNGDLRIIYPHKFNEESEYYTRDYMCSNKSAFEKYLENKLQNYPKYKDIYFGRVKFINEAKIQEQKKLIDSYKDKAAVLEASDTRLESISKKYEERIKKLNSELEEKERNISSLRSEKTKLEQNIRRLNLTIDDIKNTHQQEIEELNYVITRKDQHLDRPQKPDKIPEWVERNFKDKLILHPRACNMIKSTPLKEVNMNMLCDALEYLAYEYRDEQLGLITEDERNNLCMKKYNRPFSIAPTGDKCIKTYNKQYKVKYGKGFKGKPIETALDTHLRVGVDSDNLLRIYFFFDKEKKIVVVGSMPKHLKTMTVTT